MENKKTSIKLSIENICPDYSLRISEFGFHIVEDDYQPEAFGNSFIVLENSDMRVRFVRDRGQLSLDFAPLHEPDNWWDARFVSQALNGRNASATDFEQGVDLCSFLISNYDGIVDIFRSQNFPKTQKEFEEFGNERLQQILTPTKQNHS